MPSAADPPVIEVERVALGYGDRVVLENLDFTVARGDVFAILGGSGSGKSTLLRALIGLDEPSAGLDPVTSAELDDLIATLNVSLGMTTVIVTHELRSIFAIVRHCIMLDGRARGIIARGEPATLRDGSVDPQVRAFFNPRARAA
ncbi:MAG: ATP-binding cassette domain-containing protein [Deltaproteobacteria bacterium]|nr:MAG: ATP-binding cassette domain-containing protein [Deltaproteobacteria bacterium]